MEDFSFEINWDVEKHQMRSQVHEFIKGSRKHGKSITLPVSSQIETVFMMLSRVNCKGCNAACCKIGPSNKSYVGLAPSEYKRLVKLGAKNLIQDEIGGRLPLPCQFLNNNRCSIYGDRPLTCLLFPYQPRGLGASDHNSKEVELLSVASYCPEAVKIARSLYMFIWRIKQKVFSIGKEEALSILEKHSTKNDENGSIK